MFFQFNQYIGARFDSCLRTMTSDYRSLKLSKQYPRARLLRALLFLMSSFRSLFTEPPACAGQQVEVLASVHTHRPGVRFMPTDLDALPSSSHDCKSYQARRQHPVATFSKPVSQGYYCESLRKDQRSRGRRRKTVC